MRWTWMIALGALACTGDPVVDDTDAGTETEAPTPRHVVDAAWLQAHLDEVHVVDVRSPEEFEAGHIAGAVNVPWNDLRATVDGVSGQVAPPDKVASILASAGVPEDGLVVAYGGRAGRDAGRLAWTLHYYDHADAVILDVAWQGWVRAEGATEAGPVVPEASGWTAGPTNDRVRVSKDQVLDALDDDSILLLDVRSKDEFDAGRIPGAVHVEWTDNAHVDGPDEGLLRSREEILALYPGADLRAPVYVYCRSGARAGLPYVALQWAGFEDVRLYDGSWNEWSIDGPVEK